MATTSSSGRTSTQAVRELQAVLRAGEDAAAAALGVVGLMIVNQIKVITTGPPLSRAGAPPGLRTGGLRLSYEWEPGRGHGKAGNYIVIRSNTHTLQPVPPNKPVIYASYLEYGTSKMRPRPHFRPAVEMISPLIPGIVGAAWTGGVNTRSRA